MKNIIYFILASLISSQVMAAYKFKVVSRPVGVKALTFVQNADTQEKYYNQLIDYAQLEKMAPLSSADLASVTAEDIRTLSMEEFNQLYARLSAGPMPLGDYSGYILQKPPVYNAVKKRILKQASVFANFLGIVKNACNREAEDCLFEFIWKGKRFLPADKMDQIETLTTINFGSSALTKFTPDILKGVIPSSIKAGIVNAADRLSFTGLPMHVYCGESLVDTRRESIITDGAFADDFANYSKLTDEVITRKGLKITEEYRMVRPGLYIGKAYSNKLFLFNVALEISGSAPSTQLADTCFDGKTTR